MPDFPENSNLADLQSYIKDLCDERGWDDNTHLDIFLLFAEEVGELAKAIRNTTRLHVDEEKKVEDTRAELEGEFADVLSYLLDLANHFDVDLEKAIREKQEANQKRVWG